MAKAISEMTLEELKQRKGELESFIESAGNGLSERVNKGLVFNGAREYIAAQNDLSQINMEIARKTEGGTKSGAN